MPRRLVMLPPLAPAPAPAPATTDEAVLSRRLFRDDDDEDAVVPLLLLPERGSFPPISLEEDDDNLRINEIRREDGDRG